MQLQYKKWKLETGNMIERQRQQRQQRATGNAMAMIVVANKTCISVSLNKIERHERQDRL